MNDSFLLDVRTDQMVATAPTPNPVFLFQMPTVYDSMSNSIYTIDLQKFKVY